MAGPLKKLTSHQASRSGTVDQPFSAPGGLVQRSRSVSLPREPLPSYFSESLPCVLYECNASFELTYVSENTSELLSIDASELVGNRLLSNERIPGEDLIRLSNRLEELEHQSGMISLVHRILNGRGLPFWVAHNLWKANLNNTTTIRGCMVPMDYNGVLNSS